MQKKILVVIFVFLIFVVLGVFIALIKYAKSIPNVSNFINNYSEVKVADIDYVGDWVKEMAGISKRDYHLPVNDLFVKIDYKEEPVVQKRRFYELIINRTDNYSLFCITQTLSNFSLPYIIFKDTKGSKIHIQSNDMNKIGDFVNKLKKYNIHSSVKEVWL